ncbi:hypothetical protein HK096_004119 [Nowakowskiella sp. JEL0078]|nr:hypothetical protein HK096_004119 [Nowakowskiella sp. JEL0078]
MKKSGKALDKHAELGNRRGAAVAARKQFATALKKNLKSQLDDSEMVRMFDSSHDDDVISNYQQILHRVKSNRLKRSLKGN